MEPNLSRAAYSIEEFSKRQGFGRDKTYDEIRAGRLKAKKAGRRTLITAEEERRYLDSLPDLHLGDEG